MAREKRLPDVGVAPGSPARGGARCLGYWRIWPRYYVLKILLTCILQAVLVSNRFIFQDGLPLPSRPPIEWIRNHRFYRRTRSARRLDREVVEIVAERA